jgi:hypothetical protein
VYNFVLLTSLLALLCLPAYAVRKRGSVPSSEHGSDQGDNCPLVDGGSRTATPLVAYLDGSSTNPDTCNDGFGTTFDITYPNRSSGPISGTGFSVTITPALWGNGGLETLVRITFNAPANYTLNTLAIAGNFNFAYVACSQNSPNLNPENQPPSAAGFPCVKSPVVTIPQAQVNVDHYQYNDSNLTVQQPDPVTFAETARNVTVLDFVNLHGGSSVYLQLDGILNDQAVIDAANSVFATWGFGSFDSTNTLNVSLANVHVTATDGNGNRLDAGGLTLSHPCNTVPCPAPTNDSVNSPTLISGNSFNAGSYKQTVDISGATHDANDPSLTQTSVLGSTNCYDGTGNTDIFGAGELPFAARTVWYSFTAAAAGPVTLNTEGSRFDTRLAAYDGKPTSGTASLLCADDTSLGNNVFEPQAKLTLNTTSGHTYYIMASEAPKPKGTVLDNSGVVLDAQGQPAAPPTAFAVSPIPGASNAVLSVQLSTIGAVLSADKTSLSFSPQRVATTRSTLDVTLSSASGSVNGITASGGSDFTVTNGCSGATLTGSATCVLHVSFSPTADGSRNGTLSVSSNAVLGPSTISLTGSGYIPQANLSAASLDFGTQALNTTSSSKKITVTNGGDGPLTIAGYTSSGALAPFALQSTTCGASLPSGSSCEFNFTFTPTSAGAANVNFTVTDDASGPGSQQTVSLTGTGAAPVTLGPVPANFGTIVVNAQSSIQTVTLHNGTANLLSITNITISGDFRIRNNFCNVPPTSLAANASCSFDLAFAPKTTGVANGSLSVTDNAGTQSVALVGTGIDVMVTPTRPGRPTRIIPSVSPTLPAPTLLGTNTANTAKRTRPSLSVRVRMKMLLE